MPRIQSINGPAAPILTLPYYTIVGDPIFAFLKMVGVIVKTQPKQKSVRNGKRKENAARKSSTRNA